MHPQLTLPLDTAPAASFDTFTVAESNRVVVASIHAFAKGSVDDQQIYVWGDAGSGKSHLLSAACLRVNELGYRVAYLPGELANQPQATHGLEQCDFVCIDDLQRLDHAAEEDLFHCINRCRDAQTRLLFAADRQPDSLGLHLADLATRLSWGAMFYLDVLADKDLGKALRHELEIRALDVSEEVVGFLLRRYPRDMRALKQVVDRLDVASMREQHRITIPLIKRVLGDTTIADTLVLEP